MNDDQAAVLLMDLEEPRTRRLAMFSESAASNFTDSMERRLRQLEIFRTPAAPCLSTVPRFWRLSNHRIESRTKCFRTGWEIVIVRHCRAHIDTD